MKRSKYTKEILENAVRSSKSYAQVIRSFGIKPTGGAYGFFKDKILDFGIDTSHFTGELWSKGQTKETNEILRKQSEIRRYKPETLFRDGVSYKGGILRKALIDTGVEEKCQLCGLLPMWNDKPLRLHVDHISGNRRDCRKENLRFLCPNCHQQTPTWGGGNVPRVIYEKIPLKEKEEKVKNDGEWRKRDRFSTRKVNRPTKEFLFEELKTKSLCQIGREYGVSDNAVRKWCKRYGL